MEPRGDAMGGLVEYLKTKDGVVLTSWTKNPRPWVLHPYNKVVATIDTLSTSSGSIDKSDRASIPSILDAEYKALNKNELKFRSDSWNCCSSEKEKQFVTLVGSLLYYFQCARMLQLSSINLYFNVWMQNKTHRVDARMKFKDRVLKFLEGRQDTPSFGRLLSGLRDYKRETSERDTSDFYFNGLVFSIEETLKELCMLMSIALRFEPWSLPISITEFSSESHFPALRCIGRGITLAEAKLVAEEGEPMHCIVPAGSAVVFGTMGVREFVIWKPRGINGCKVRQSYSGTSRFRFVPSALPATRLKIGCLQFPARSSSIFVCRKHGPSIYAVVVQVVLACRHSRFSWTLFACWVPKLSIPCLLAGIVL